MFNFAVIFLTQSTMLTRTATRGSATALPDACWHPVLFLPKFKKKPNSNGGGGSWSKSSWPSQEAVSRSEERQPRLQKNTPEVYPEALKH